jgi:heterodisulfide reductase subunit B
MPQAIGLAMGISPQDLGLRRHIVNTRPLVAQFTVPTRY